MGNSINWSLVLPALALLVLCTATPAAAFGAGNIPSYAYLEGKAFRHGDIEDVIEELSRSGGAAAGVLGALTGGLLAKKFKGLDIKRIYFGNWLRDYSQAMDVAGLSKLSAQAIINLIMVLGFMAHGYATGEFEVTEERLGCYLPTEHIDNPKDYNDNKDARQVYSKLRPPVDPKELEIDPRSGMLNYIANENGHWDTSRALVRRVLLQCIDLGRRARGGAGSDAQYEAFRLLGSALHTLEDFTAHSNYCELALHKLGYNQVFCHVGSSVHVRAPDGSMVPPLVTGTFGGSDFIHSLLGEATDHISSASVSDLNKEIEKAKNKPADRGIDGIRDMLFQLPGGEGNNLSRDMDDINNMRAAGTSDPMNMSPQELHAVLWKILKFRDDVSKAITNTIERIPGLGSLIEKIGDSVSTFVFVTIEPYIKPILQQATGVLQQGSAQVVNSQDQFRVFNDPNFYHPTHSILAKDHFNMILNEPAGQIARLVVRHVVQGVVKAWDDQSINAQQMVEQFLDVMHHPSFQNGNQIQREMFEHMRSWIGAEDKNYTLNALTKDAVRSHKNHRKGHATEEPSHGPGGYTSFLPTPASLQNQATNYVHQQAQHIPGYSQYNQMFPTGPRRDFDGSDMPTQNAMHTPVGGTFSGNAAPAHQSYGGHSEPPHQYQQSHSPYPGQDHSQFAGQHPPQHQGGGYPGPGGPPPFGGFGGPPPHAPHGGFGGPPPPPAGWGGPPPPGQGWNAHPPHGSGPSPYPGAQYEQSHQGQGNQGGYPGSNWSANQPPPSGRW